MIKYTSNFTFLLCFFLCTSLNAQSFLNGKTVQDKKDYSQLDELISEYNIYELNISKKDIKVSSENPFLKLELGETSYDLNLFQNNLNYKYKKTTETPLLLGGSLRSGGSVSLTVNDGFIYGFIKSGNIELYIEPLSYLVKGAPSNQFITYYAHQLYDYRIMTFPHILYD